MKKTMLTCLLILATVTCASTRQSGEPTTPRPTKVEINKEFRPYIKRFVEISNGRVTMDQIQRIPITFKEYGPDESDDVGTCYYTRYSKRITINEVWWKKTTSNLQKEVLMFHELGHCALLRPHTRPETPLHPKIPTNVKDTFTKVQMFEDKPYLTDGCPPSYMHPFVLSSACVEKHYYYYLDELFEVDETLYLKDAQTHNYYNSL